MIKLFLVSSDNNNSFGVSAVIKNLSKELNKYCMVNKNFHINNLLNSQKKILHIHGCWSLKVFFYFIIAKLLNIKIILSTWHGRSYY